MSGSQTYENLTEAQRDGRACIGCGGENGPMVPVGRINRVQVFAHEGCVEDPVDLARQISAEDLGWEMDGEEPPDVR